MNNDFNLVNSVQTHFPTPPQALVINIKELLRTEEVEVKEQALKNLDKMFQELHAVDSKKVEFTPLFGMIVGRYGCRLYPVFEEALPCLQAALQLQLQGLNLIPKEDFLKYSSLEDFKKSQLSFSNLNHWLTTTDSKMYPELLKLKDDEKLTLAKTLLFLGYTYGHTANIKEQLNVDQKGLTKFGIRLNGGIKELLCSMEQTPAVQKELGEMYYNIFPGLYLEERELETGHKATFEDIEESFKIRWEAAKYNPALSMRARIHNLKACHLSDFKEHMSAAKQESQKSLEIWEKVLADPNLTKAEKELYDKLYLNAKSVLGYILRETGAPLEELEAFGKGYREFYEAHKDRDPYSMIHLIGLCKLELHKGNKSEVLKWVAIIEEISQKYQAWPDTANILKQAQDLKSKAN